MATSYNTLLSQLYTLTQKAVKYSLDTPKKLCSLLGNPQNRYPTIHISGTNGKGTTATMIAKTLESAGYRVGLYTSPHISCYRERIQINSSYITEEAVKQWIPHIRRMAEKEGLAVSFFELTTTLAFLYFAEKQVDVAVIEVGLGGRLDATNVITPLVSVITSISLEHTELLGETVLAIAKEKAGIIKSGIPVVAGPTVPVEALGAASQLFITADSDPKSLAKAALDIVHTTLPFEESDLDAGLQQRPPCRMEIHHNGRVILDIAHNPASLEHLFQTLPNEKYRIVFALSKSKDVERCLTIVTNHASHLHLVSTGNDRNISSAQWKKEAEILPSATYTISDDPEREIEKALNLANKKGEKLVVCGTFFIMDAAYNALNINRIKDSIDMNTKISYSRAIKI